MQIFFLAAIEKMVAVDFQLKDIILLKVIDMDFAER